MAKPYWLVKALSIFTIVLFTVDTGTDGYVGYDLYNRCHYKYAASVLSFVAVPGFFTGAILSLMLVSGHFDDDDESFIEKYGVWRGLSASIPIVLLGSIFGAILFIPGTFIYLVYSAIKTSDDTQEKSKYAKGMEMLLESFPQFILSLFMMQALQLTETLNIVSCSVSGVSVLYGLGDFLAMDKSETQGNYPFSMTVWGTLSTIIDTLFRSFLLAYWMTISKTYVIIVPFVYCIIMGLVTFIKAKKHNFENFYLSFFNTIISFGISSL